ncbi:MAG: response regulator transcription factor [Deltaproteobacteria bacterium]|nr:response regulator transcription factor [Deltaproteobacteria bacterium]
MAGKKGVLIVDDHPLFREGLRNTVTRSGKFEVVGEAGKAREALRLALEIKPDLVLIDISLPDQSGIELTRALRRSVPEAALLIVSVHSATNYIADSFAAGAAGYLVKDSLPETLMQALEVVSEGGCFLDGPVSRQTVDRLKGLNAPTSSRALPRYESLTRRQREVMHLLVQGLSYKAIGEELCISPRTVEGHRNEIMKVLELSNRVELIQYALKLGLLEPYRADV